MNLSSIRRARAEAACSRLGQAFVAHLDLENFEALAALFTVDGIVQRVSGEVLRGREAIAQSLRRPPGQIALHHASPVHVEMVSESEATGVSSFLAFLGDPPEHRTTVRVAGIWRDLYRFEGRRWLIAERRAEVRMSGYLT